MKTTQILHEKGFSLLEVLVAVAIMGGLSLVMLQMNQNQLKQQKTVELKGEITDIMNIIRQTLDTSKACNMSFANRSPGDIITELRSSTDPNLAPFATIGEVKFQNYNVYIKEMKLLSRAEQLLIDKNPAPVDFQNGAGSGILKITFVRNVGEVSASNTSHNFFGGKEKVEYLPIYGYFYDSENLYASTPDNNQFKTLCESAAANDGVTCDLSSLNPPCAVTPVSPTPDYLLGNATGMYYALCKYFRSDSPLRSCITTR